jgi:hypothetical protein
MKFRKNRAIVTVTVLTVAAVLGMAGPAQAGPPGDGFAVRGPGIAPCPDLRQSPCLDRGPKNVMICEVFPWLCFLPGSPDFPDLWQPDSPYRWEPRRPLPGEPGSPPALPPLPSGTAHGDDR